MPQTRSHESLRLPPGPLLATVLVVCAAVLPGALPVLRNPSGLLYGRLWDGYHYDPFMAMDFFRALSRAPWSTETLLVIGPYLEPAIHYPGALLSRWFSEPAAHNLLNLAGFPLAAATGFLLGWRVSRSRVGAMAAGLGLALSPHRQIHAAYHLDHAGLHWLPLLLLAGVLWLEKPRPARTVLLVGAALLVGATDPYQLFFTVLLAPVVLAGKLRRLSFRGALGLALAGLVVAAAWGPIRSRVVQRLTPYGVIRPAEDLALYSARPGDYLVPFIGHPLWGARAEGLLRSRLRMGGNLVERTVHPGFGVLLLAGIGLTNRRRGSSGASRTGPLVAGILLLFWLSLPPSPLTLSGPLHRLFPWVRCFARAAAPLTCLLAAAAALGTRRLTREWGRLAWLVPLVVILELVPGRMARPVLATAVQSAAPTEEPRLCLELPEEYNLRGEVQESWQGLRHCRGARLERVLTTAVGPDGRADPGLLAADGIELLLAHAGEPEPMGPGWELLARDTGGSLWRVRAEPPPVSAWFGPGFHRVEGDPTDPEWRGIRWLDQDGRLLLRSEDPEIPWIIRFRALSRGRARRLELVSPEGTLASWWVGSDWLRGEGEIGRIPRAGRWLRFRAEPGPERISRRDPRSVSIALAGLELVQTAAAGAGRQDAPIQ